MEWTQRNRCVKKTCFPSRKSRFLDPNFPSFDDGNPFGRPRNRNRWNRDDILSDTISRAHRRCTKIKKNKKKKKIPVKRGSMYILIVFLFSPPSLLISIRLSSTWTHSHFTSTNRLSLDAGDHSRHRSAPTCTISHRGGAISSLARSCHGTTLDADHPRSIAGTIAPTIVRKKKPRNK